MSEAATSPVPSSAPPAETSGPPGNKRFDLFVIDLGWKSPIAEVLRNNMPLLRQYQLHYNLYALSAEQCRELFRIHPSMIGNEPSLIVLDREAQAAERKQGYGFKLNLGMIRDVTTANSILKWCLAVLAEQRPGSDLTAPIRTVMHKEGIRGAVDIIADITRSPFGETATH